MSTVKTILNIAVSTLMGIASIIFAILYIETFYTGFIFENAEILKWLSVSVITVLTLSAMACGLLNKKLANKIILCALFLVLAAAVLLFILKYFNILDKFTSIEDLRNFISGMGSYAIFGFILIQFLQVVVLPIPSVITVGAGVACFGPWLGGFLSFVGIFIGSMVAFLIGRIFGYRAAAWIVGKETLDKWLEKVKGKDKLLLTFMFLMPLFPDDVLCFVAGLSTMSFLFFVVMIAIVRLITIYVTAFSLNGSIIPYDTWWGICIWILFFAAAIALMVILYKKGDKIQKFLKEKFGKKNKK